MSAKIRCALPALFFGLSVLIYPSGVFSSDSGSRGGSRRIVAQAAVTEESAATPETLAAQESVAAQDGSGRGQTDVPHSFRGISLGMELEAVKDALADDAVFGYRGERDVSLLPGDKPRNLIETSGNSFILRSWFQFSDGVLYNMSFSLDNDRIDYFSLFSSLSEKYGEPDTVDPAKAVWSSDTYRLSLERPLTVKYLDLAVFNSIVTATEDTRTYENTLRDDFVQQF